MNFLILFFRLHEAEMLKDHWHPNGKPKYEPTTSRGHGLLQLEQEQLELEQLELEQLELELEQLEQLELTKLVF